MAAGVTEAAEVLQEVIALVRRPDADVAWSRYDNAGEAVADLSDHLARLTAGDTSRLRDLELLFGPTGAVQEISLGSGWGDYYLTLAARFDQAVEKIVPA